jgi:DNA-binding Xre family transcriptional regulator
LYKSKNMKNNLEKLMQNAKITDTELGAKVGLSSHQIRSMRLGVRGISIKHIPNLCKILNCKTSDLIENFQEDEDLSLLNTIQTTEKTTDLNNDNLKLINFNDLKDAEVIDLIQAYKDNPDAIHEASFLEDLFDENVRYILKWKINTDLLAPDYNKNDPVFIVLGYETIIDQFGTFLLQNKNNLKLFRKIRQREDGIFEVITLADRQLYPNQEYTTREAMPFKILGKVEYALKKS